jgi:signal transduction histidine kinase
MSMGGPMLLRCEWPLAVAARVALLVSCCVMGLVWALPLEPAPAALVHFTVADVQVARTPRSGTEAQGLAVGNALRPANGAPWQRVPLPDLIPRVADLRASALDDSAIRWYRLRYTVPAAGEHRDDRTGAFTAARSDPPPLGVYIPRMITGALSVLVRNVPKPGQADPPWQVLHQSNERWRVEWNRPLLWPLPSGFAAGTDIEVVVGCMVVQERGLHVASTMWVGPVDELSWRVAWRQLLQLQAPMATSLLIAFVGLFAAGVWWRRRHERAYLYLALAAGIWGFRNLHYYIDTPRELEAAQWFWWATHASLSWLMLLIYCFALRFDSRRHPRVERALWVTVLLSSVLTLPLWSLPFGSLLVQHLVNAATSLTVTIYLTWLCWRGGPELRAVTLACWLNLALGINDLQLVSGKINPETLYLLPYSPLLVFASFLYATWRRYVQAIAQVEDANNLLEQRLRERETELQANHLRLRTVEREQALLLERQRLMADMHDGIGSTLMSSLMMLEHGQMDSQGAAGLVRECVDDLRLVIDSLDPFDNDLVALLSTLRHRLGRRMQAAGVDLQWAMGELPPLNWLSASDALQVLRVMQELLTNVLKHAAARQVQVRVGLTDHGEVEVAVSDDGQGFDVTAVQARGGRGMSNLQLRARQLQGRLSVDSTPGHGTRVRLILPVHRPTRPTRPTEPVEPDLPAVPAVPAVPTRPSAG